MESDKWITIGRVHNVGRRLKICCTRETKSLESGCLERFRIVYIKDGYGVFRNGENSQIITSPMVLCLNNTDNVELYDANNLSMDIMYFDPSCYDGHRSPASVEQWRSNLDDDFYFFRPFFTRSETYIGALATNHYVGSRVAQLIALADEELTKQKDHFWPCRGRSYFIELVLLMNSIFSEDIAHEKVFIGKMTDEIREVVAYLHQHYMDRIVMEDVTRQFHTNKTTLNQKFKEVMGITVMEYIQDFKLQVACSLLRQTSLPVREIMERAGFRDDAHFQRSFKKYAGCSPSVYRNRFEEV